MRPYAMKSVGRLLRNRHMFQDPIIKEIRKIRHEIEAEYQYQYDSQKYYEHLQELQKNTAIV